jgi:hypothetical protein
VGSSSDRVKLKTIKLVLVASPLSTQRQGERAKTGWPGFKPICGILFIYDKLFLSILVLFPLPTTTKSE